MAIHWTIDEDQGLFVEVWEGLVTACDACGAVDKAVLDPRYRAGMRGLLDMRRAQIGFGTAGVEQIFRKKRQYADLHVGWRWALVATTTSQIATCALYVSITDHTPIEISAFGDLDTALHWLGAYAPAQLR